MRRDDPEARRIRNLERIQRFRLLDDVFMKEVLRDNIAGVQDIVRVLLRRDDITVLEVRTQDELSNLVGHSVRLDVLARDASGTFYNIEIQRAEHGADARRARYHLGAVDWHTFPAGADYDKLPETWIIFITETDFFGKGLPVYSAERVILETGERFRDGGHILYANAAYVGDNDMGKLMADFRTADPGAMHYESLASRARYYKNAEGGVISMCRIMEELRLETWEEARKVTQEEDREKMIEALLMCNSEGNPLYQELLSRLHITQDEIDAAQKRIQAVDAGKA